MGLPLHVCAAIYSTARHPKTYLLADVRVVYLVEVATARTFRDISTLLLLQFAGSRTL